MPAYKFVVFTNPAEGKEAEYNRWYDEIHLGEVTSLPGFTGARRLRNLPQGDAAPKHKYMAIYEIESDDIAATMKGLFEHASAGRFNMSDAMGADVETLLYEETTVRDAARA